MGQGVGEQNNFFEEIMAEISEGKKNHHMRQIEHRDQDVDLSPTMTIIDRIGKSTPIKKQNYNTW